MDENNKTHPNAYRTEAAELRVQATQLNARADELDAQAAAREKELGLAPPDEESPKEATKDSADQAGSDEPQPKKKLLGK